MGWKDQKHLDHTTKDKSINKTIDLSQLDDETLARLRAAEVDAEAQESDGD